LVEILTTLSGASFSLDAAPFDRGTTSPGIGVFLLGIDPTNFGGSIERLSRQFESLRNDHEVRLSAVEITALPNSIKIDSEILQRLREAAT
jgi:(2R)-3-sulfolactate dehydrogenase (NADP+)